MSTIANKVYKGKKFSITPASLDDPIYNRGFVIGGKNMKESDTVKYVRYRRDHREEFEDEPPSGVCGTQWIEMRMKGQIPMEDDWPMRVRKRYEQYHLEKAKVLGLEISVDEMTWINNPNWPDTWLKD